MKVCPTNWNRGMALALRSHGREIVLRRPWQRIVFVVGLASSCYFSSCFTAIDAAPSKVCAVARGWIAKNAAHAASSQDYPAPVHRQKITRLTAYHLLNVRQL